MIVILITLFTVFFIFALFNQPLHNNELQALAVNHLDKTGVTNRVTAVLLNYRAYDTFIKFAVFLCVAVGVLPYILDTPILTFKLQEESQVLLIAKVFIPLTIIMASCLLWIGSAKPGVALLARCLYFIISGVWLLI